jgi:hypothetical protein
MSEVFAATSTLIRSFPGMSGYVTQPTGNPGIYLSSAPPQAVMPYIVVNIENRICLDTMLVSGISSGSPSPFSGYYLQDLQQAMLNLGIYISGRDERPLSQIRNIIAANMDRNILPFDGPFQSIGCKSDHEIGPLRPMQWLWQHNMYYKILWNESFPSSGS